MQALSPFKGKLTQGLWRTSPEVNHFLKNRCDPKASVDAEAVSKASQGLPSLKPSSYSDLPKLPSQDIKTLVLIINLIIDFNLSITII